MRQREETVQKTPSVIVRSSNSFDTKSYDRSTVIST